VDELRGCKRDPAAAGTLDPLAPQHWDQRFFGKRMATYSTAGVWLRSGAAKNYFRLVTAGFDGVEQRRDVFNSVLYRQDNAERWLGHQ
jgi:hypothetical protein